jgi:outer membrane protein TolC
VKHTLKVSIPRQEIGRLCDRPKQTLLQKQLAAQHDLLNALTGEFAGAGVRARVTSRLQLPMELPLVLSSQLVEQRPDVRAAQANLHAASALVGVAIANRIPLFNITGNIGRTSGQFDNLANSANSCSGPLPAA